MAEKQGITATMWNGDPWPSRRSYRRWKATGRLASLLYVSGITRSGGSTSWGGDDPYRSAVYTLPRWRDVLPVRGRMRPYLLFRADWWWQCHIAQGSRLRGRHTPEEPFAFGICAACMPCVECGAHRECVPDCGTGGSNLYLQPVLANGSDPQSNPTESDST